MVRRGLVEHLQSQVVGFPIRPRHLDERVNLADRWDVVRDEALDLGVQLYVVRLVAPNVPKQLANLRRHVQMGVVSRVVPAGAQCSE